MIQPGCGPVPAPGRMPALRGARAMPPLRRVPIRFSPAEWDEDLFSLASALTHSGEIVRKDFALELASPGLLIERAADRILAHLNRRSPGGPSVRAFIRPWAEILDEVDAGSVARKDRRLAVGIDSEETYRLRVGPLVAALGEAATGVILDHLVRHTPLCIEGGEDLEWIIDGWDPEGDSDEAREIRCRAVRARQILRDLHRLFEAGREGRCEAIPHHGIRRRTQALRALGPAPYPADETAWRETQDVEWALPVPVVQLVWDDACPLDHAADEAEFIRLQDGSSPCPQLMWLLDPADPQSAVTAWQRWRHALRTTHVASRLISALDALSPDPQSP